MKETHLPPEMLKCPGNKAYERWDTLPDNYFQKVARAPPPRSARPPRDPEDEKEEKKSQSPEDGDVEMTDIGEKSGKGDGNDGFESDGSEPGIELRGPCKR